jgi:hypothetical protein
VAVANVNSKGLLYKCISTGFVASPGLKIREERVPRALGLLPLEEFAGEGPSGEGPIGKEGDVIVVASLG